MSGVEQPGTGGGGAGAGPLCVGEPVPDWSAPSRPPGATLVACTTVLETLHARHVDDLANAWAGTGEPHWTYLPMERPEGRAEVSAVVASMVDDPGSVAYAVLVRGRAVGVLSLMRIDPPSGWATPSRACSGRPS